MAQSAVIHHEYEFTGHNAVINTVCYNRQHDCFVTADNTCLRLWSAAKHELRCIALPPRTNSFIQCIEYIESRQVYVASALDGTLKIYDLLLNEIVSIFTARATILSMVFDARHNRLLTGGVDGCAAWLVRGKPPTVIDSTMNPHYELSPLPSFFTLPPTPASSASTSNSTNAKTTGARAPSGTGAAARAASNSHYTPDGTWVQSIQLNGECSKVYAQGKHCVDVFSAYDGQYLESYRDLFPTEHGAIMSFVVHEKTQYIVCGCITGAIYVLSVHPISIVHVFKDHTMSVSSLVVHASSNLIISSSLDGTVRLWDLEARRQAHRLDIGRPVQALQLLVPNAHTCRFYCRIRSSVQIHRIQSTVKEHLPSLSPISVLQRIVFSSPEDDESPPIASSQADNESSNNTNRLAADGLSQWIIAAGTDKTVRLFAGQTANEAPTFTWIPEETSLDVIGFALHPAGNRLFLLLESQQVVVVNSSPPVSKEEKPFQRVIHLDPQVSLTGGSGAARAGAGTGTRNASGTGAHGSTRGSIRTICCCNYPPIFRSAAPSNSFTASTTAAAQSKWFSRTFSTRRLPSSRELRQDSQRGLLNADPEVEQELITSEYEWVVCGGEFGHLVFWHTGLRNVAQEGISIDAHDAAVIAIASSATTSLMVSLDDAKRLNVWHLQPVFTLCYMVDLEEKPTCFVLSPTSELLLTGYEDGTVTLMNMSIVTDVQTFTDEENHSAMISAADFLDEKHLVLSASVDAVIKVWDQEKNLLRQVSIAMALTSLCFMNVTGDVMAGLSSGIFILSRNDVLPEKLPAKPTRRKGGSSPPSRGQPVLGLHESTDASLSRGSSPPTGDPIARHAGVNSSGRASTVTKANARSKTHSASPSKPEAASETDLACVSWIRPKGSITNWLAQVSHPAAGNQPPPVLRPLKAPEQRLMSPVRSKRTI